MSTEPAKLNPHAKRKRSRVPARELHALADDNNQRSARNLPKCPLCQQRIEPQYWQLHYDYELGRLDEIGSDIYTNPLDKTRGKRGAAVLALQHMERKHRKQPVSVYEETLEKVKQHSTQRKEALKRLGDTKGDDSPLAVSTSTMEQPGNGEQRCFLCNETLFGDLDAINLHIDHCLVNMNGQPEAATTTSTTSNNHHGTESNNVASGSSHQWDEYEWAGQVRVRATAMMEGGYAGAGFATTSRKEDDVDEDLDIEDDDAEYGHSQYNERDILVSIDNDNDEDSNALREMVSGGSSRQIGTKDEENETQLGFEETVSDAGWERHLEDHRLHDVSAHATGNLVIDSLRSRIHQLETASRSVPRCLICLEPYKTPLTSIVCWHVHCEQCWLQTLGSKKLCPQCQKITTPSDLRRIYL